MNALFFSPNLFLFHRNTRAIFEQDQATRRFATIALTADFFFVENSIFQFMIYFTSIESILTKQLRWVVENYSCRNIVSNTCSSINFFPPIYANNSAELNFYQVDNPPCRLWGFSKLQSTKSDSSARASPKRLFGSYTGSLQPRVANFFRNKRNLWEIKVQRSERPISSLACKERQASKVQRIWRVLKRNNIESSFGDRLATIQVFARHRWRCSSNDFLAIAPKSTDSKEWLFARCMRHFPRSDAVAAMGSTATNLVCTIKRKAEIGENCRANGDQKSSRCVVGLSATIQTDRGYYMTRRSIPTPMVYRSRSRESESHRSAARGAFVRELWLIFKAADIARANVRDWI